MLIKSLMKLGVMTTINESIDGDTAELLVIEFLCTSVLVSQMLVGLDGNKDEDSQLKFALQ